MAVGFLPSFMSSGNTGGKAVPDNRTVNLADGSGGAGGTGAGGGGGGGGVTGGRGGDGGDGLVIIICW
jgi:hypothetical protein